MQQVIQNIKSGELSVKQVPAPMVSPGHVLIANQASLVSAGTEKMVMDLAKKSLLGKARERPDQVRRVLEKIKNEGLFNTIQQVRTKLDEPIAMGYSSSGIVLACGAGVQNFKPGDRVASNGPHAEFVSVPKNLCAHVPDRVTMNEAAFGVLGSISMQAVRLSESGLGDCVFVIGLGLVGQLAVGLLAASGCRVIGTDLDESKCKLALKMGAEIATPNLTASQVEELTNGLGADSVLIAASTKSNAPIEIAASAVRQKGRVVLVGVVGLELDRRPWYFKEAEFVVSCSYGPGRYDANYEDRGHDYPAAYVRWTQQRNIQSVLQLIENGRLNVKPLISHRFAIEHAGKAYEVIENQTEPFLGIVLEYPEFHGDAPATKVQLKSSASKSSSGHPSNGKIRCGVLGAGNFARMVLIPAIEKSGAFEPATICSARGLSAATTGKSAGFDQATSSESNLFNDDSLQAVFSITRHDQHASHVMQAIESGKHIFVEKPLCLTLDELSRIANAINDAGDSAPMIMVGFNRRFAPSVAKLKKFLSGTDRPMTVSIRFNAGPIPGDHWTQNDEEGGGRLVGEACHAIDLASYLVGSPPVRVYAESVALESPDAISDDQCFITLRHGNGSISSIGYLAGGDKSFSKERIEVIGGNRVGIIDDYKTLTLCTRGKTETQKMSADKGHQNEINAWAEGLKSGRWPIPWDELRAVSAASILASRSLREGVPFQIN